MRTEHRVIFGDARNMALIDNRSIHLVITSPPYWQLKDYGAPGQIGFDDTYEDYINNLNLVWQECHRVIHDGCRLCVNIGDQFARSVYYGRYKVIPIRTEIIRFCETIGFDFMGSIIWQKVTTCNTTGGATIMGSYPYPRNGIVKIDYEFILLFKKHGEPPKVDRDAKERSEIDKDEWNVLFNGHWNFPGERQNGHLAMFPEELPRRLIKMFSFAGEWVLDPFLGSGTTCLAAANLGRNSVGYEINREFESLIREKVSRDSGEVSFSVDASRMEEKPAVRLPYLFRDPLALDKKTDPRAVRFGSRIAEGDSAQRRDDLAKVSEVLSANLVRLSDGTAVRLLGVEPLRGKRREAVLFLRKMMEGKPVYLQYDEVSHDDSGNRLAYLYLKNKTFVNAHLVKQGLAVVDPLQPVTKKALLKLATGRMRCPETLK